MTDWQPIETAPKSEIIDIWAKSWNPETDTFDGQRFPNFKWTGTRFTGPPRVDGSRDFLTGWRPTHWRPLPKPPK